MSKDELDMSYRDYLGKVKSFHNEDKMVLSLVLARLCTIYPAIEPEVREAIPSFYIVKDKTKEILYENTNHTDSRANAPHQVAEKSLLDG